MADRADLVQFLFFLFISKQMTKGDLRH